MSKHINLSVSLLKNNNRILRSKIVRRVVIPLIAGITFSAVGTVAYASFFDSNGALNFNNGVNPVSGSYEGVGQGNLKITSSGYIMLNSPNATIVQGGGLTVEGSLQVTGNSLLQGPVTASGGITGNLTGDVTGDVTGNLTGNVTTNDIEPSDGTNLNIGTNMDGGTIWLGSDGQPTVNITGDLNVDGVITGDGSGITDLTVSSDTVSSVILTAGSVAFDGDVTANSLTSNNDLNVYGNSYLNSNLVVLGNEYNSPGESSIVVDGRLYGNDGGPVIVGNYAEGQVGFKVWGTTDLRGDFSVGGWGVGDGNQDFNVDVNCGYGESSAGCITLGSVQDESNIYVNGRLYGAPNGDGGLYPVTVGHASDWANSGFLVWGLTKAQGGLQVGDTWNSEGVTVYGDQQINDLEWSNNALQVNDPNGAQLLNVDTACDGDAYSCVTVGTGSGGGELDVNATTFLNGNVFLGNSSSDNINVNGRLYGNDGDPVTVGHYSATSGFKVWGNTDLRGDLSVGGWGTDGNLTDFQVTTDCGYAGAGGCLTLGGDYYNGTVTVNGRLYGPDGTPVTVGHYSDYSNSGFKVWGLTQAEGGLDVGESWNHADLTVYGNSTLGTSVDDSITINGRLYGNAGGPVTVGRYSGDNQPGLKVWGNTDLRGGLSVGGFGGSGDVNVNGGNDLNVNDGGDLYVSGTSEFGSTVYLDDGFVSNYGNLEVDNGYSLYVNDSGNIVDDGNLSVNGTATINNIVVNNSETFNGTVAYSGAVTFNGNATFNGSLNGGTTTLTGALSATSATFSNTLTANAGVDFHGASSLRVPVTATAISSGSTVCSTTGLLTFSTSDNHFYGCDGTVWRQLDN